MSSCCYFTFTFFLKVPGAGEASHHRASACFCTTSSNSLLFIDLFSARSCMNDYKILMNTLLSCRNLDYPMCDTQKAQNRVLDTHI